jgi:hypothetical protein
MKITKPDFKIIFNKMINKSNQDNLNLLQNISNNSLSGDYQIDQIIGNYSSEYISKVMNKILNNGLIGGQTSEEEPRINNNKSLIALSETESSIVPPSNINIINMTAGTITESTIPGSTIPAGTITESTIPAGTIPGSTIPAGTITESTIPATNIYRKINPSIVPLDKINPNIYHTIKPITNTIVSLPTTPEEKIKDLEKQLTKLQENYEFEKNRLDEEIRRLQQDTAPVSVLGPFGTVLTTETAQPGVSTEQEFLHKVGFI